MKNSVYLWMKNEIHVHYPIRPKAGKVAASAGVGNFSGAGFVFGVERFEELEGEKI